MRCVVVISSIIIFCLGGRICAQPYLFNKNYEFNNYIIGYCGSTLETDSHFVTVGVCNDFTVGGPHFIRINKYGDTLFHKSFVQSIQGFASTGSSGSMTFAPDDSTFLYCGGENNTGNYDVVLYKFHLNGDTIWSKRFGGINNESGKCCRVLPDSGIIIIGYTESFGNGNADLYLIRADKNGNQMWMKTFGTVGVEEAVSGQQTLDGGFILSGRKNNQFYIVKTDSAGNQQWDRSYSSTIGVCFIKQLADSGYVLSGSQDISGDLQGCLIRTDKNGNLIWQNNYGQPAEDSWLYSIPIILLDGSIVCSGTYKPGNGPSDGWLLKTDGVGNQMWSRTYAKSSAANDQFYDVKLCSDNGFIMSGYTMMASQDPWLVKVDSNGCLIPNCNVGTEEWDTEEDIGFELFPNPSADIVTIRLSHRLEGTLKLYNMLGQEMKTISISREETDYTMEVSGLSQGTYLLALKVGNRLIFRKLNRL